MDPPLIMFESSAFITECVYNHPVSVNPSHYHLYAKNIANVQYDNAQDNDKKYWFAPNVCLVFFCDSKNKRTKVYAISSVEAALVNAVDCLPIRVGTTTMGERVQHTLLNDPNRKKIMILTSSSKWFLLHN
jgi:hypothetical protein